MNHRSAIDTVSMSEPISGIESAGLSEPKREIDTNVKSATMGTHDEFTCPKCGQLVYSLPSRNPPPTVCEVCNWLDEYIADPVEREQLRQKLTANP